MRIYEGSPRQDFEEVFRSIGAFLDQRGMQDVLLVEAPDGFIVQGLVVAGAAGGTWSESIGSPGQGDADLPRRRHRPVHGGGGRPARRGRRPAAAPGRGYYETAFRVLGRYMDEQKPRDVFFFEQDGAFVVRLLLGGQAGSRHVLAEFTRDDIAEHGDVAARRLRHPVDPRASDGQRQRLTRRTQHPQPRTPLAHRRYQP